VHYIWFGGAELSNQMEVRLLYWCLADRVYDEDVMEYMKSLGLKGSADSLELEILKMPPLDLVTTGMCATVHYGQVTDHCYVL